MKGFSGMFELRRIPVSGSSVTSGSRQTEGIDIMVAERTEPATPILQFVGGNIGVTGKLEWIRASELRVDRTYQRPLSESHVRSIAKKFDAESFGVITVSRRVDGSLYIVDGQHRHAAVMSLEWGEQNVPCLVYENLTVVEEAGMFYRPQTSAKRMTANDRFHAQLRENNPSALRIKEIARANGFDIHLTPNSNVPNTLNAVGALEYVARSYADGYRFLDMTLRLAKQSWPDLDGPIPGNVIRGIASFLNRYEHQVNHSRLVAILSATNPRKVDAEGREIASFLGGKSDVGVARAILKIYNNRLQSNRLPNWEDGQVKQKSSKA